MTLVSAEHCASSRPYARWNRSLEEHIEEVRSRNEELTRMLASRPFNGYVLEVVYLLIAAVTEMLDHCGGLHEADVLVRAVEADTTPPHLY
jgi:hypothetical protein